jgi:hypothetical protein
LWLALAILVAAQIAFTVWAVFQGFELKRLEAKVEALELQNRAVSEQKTETLLIMRRMAQIRSIVERKFHWSRLLNAVSDSVTKGVWLQSFSVGWAPAPAGASGRKSALSPAASGVRALRLEGSVVSPGQETAFIGKFIKELKDNPTLADLLESVELTNINQRRIRDYDVYDFTLSCTFKKDKTP